MSNWLCKRYNDGTFPFNNIVTIHLAWWIHDKTCEDMK